MSKLRTSIDAFLKSDGMHAKLDHLTAMEINSVRPLLPHALDQIMRIQTVSIFHKKIILLLDLFCYSLIIFSDWKINTTSTTFK